MTGEAKNERTVAESRAGRMPGLSSLQLKLIAVAAMLCDHGAILLTAPMSEPYIYLRAVGRLAFPLYAFLLVEGYYHTRDVKKYAARLALFALLSEIPFDLVVRGRAVDWSIQNVFFTLLIGLLMVAGMDALRLRGKRFLAVAVGIGALAAALLVRCDYDVSGVLMIFFFYLYREQKPVMCLTVGAVMVVMIGGLEIYGLLALFLIYLYNGKKGPDIVNKYVFYAFYPAHLLILWLIATYVVR